MPRGLPRGASLVLTPLFACAVESQCDSNDPEALCDRMRDASGKVIKPSKEVKALLQQYSGVIKDAAAKYGVDPRAVVGAVIAENSMNITKDRTEIKEALRKTGGLGNAVTKAVLGHSFSRGLGGINVEAAQWAEELAAKTEGRPARSYDEISEALYDHVTSIKYAAAIIRKVQDTYKEQGFDISKDPGLLASVYNLGNAERRAKAAKEAGRQPRYNYFGHFVANNIDALDDVLNYKPLVKDASNSSMFANGDVKAYAYAPDCTQTSANQQGGPGYIGSTTADGYKDKYYNQPGPSGKLSGFYQILDRTVDCNGDTWALASGANKTTGWVKESDLKERTTFLPKKNTTACQPDAVRKCQEQIGQATKGSLKNLGRDANGAFAFRLNSQDATKEINFKNWAPECLISNKAQMDQNKKMMATGQNPEITRQEATKYAQALEQKRQEIRALIGDDVDNKDFPLYAILHNPSLEKCGVTATCSHALNYVSQKPLIDEFLALDMKKTVNSLSQLKGVASRYSNLIVAQDGSETTYGEAMKEVEAQCGDLFSGDFKNLFDNSSYGYSSYKDWASFKDYVKSQYQNINDSKVQVKTVAETLSACARIRVHRSNYSITPSCSNPLYRAAVEAQAGTTLSPFMKKALATKADQDQFLSATTEWMSYPSGNRGYYGGYNNAYGYGASMDCNYLPNKLEEDIDKIKGLSCIEAIMVPDLNVVRHYTSQGIGTVVHAEFEKTDRYAIKIKDACNDK